MRGRYRALGAMMAVAALVGGGCAGPIKERDVDPLGVAFKANNAQRFGTGLAEGCVGVLTREGPVDFPGAALDDVFAANPGLHPVSECTPDEQGRYRVEDSTKMLPLYYCSLPNRAGLAAKLVDNGHAEVWCGIKTGTAIGRSVGFDVYRVSDGNLVAKPNGNFQTE
ncbi:MAG TPA: hypothetical protein VNT30_04760 [Stellaceae bacterium]|nr:hypothetical protein [Stellaceae bacterium]